MKTIHTLIPDIYELVQRKDGWFENYKSALGDSVVQRLQAHLGAPQRPSTLRLSQMGSRCPCALWHSINTPTEAEALPAWAEIKYSYGHLVEALVISLAKAAGHTVEGEQDAVKLDGITGHIDCIIDGVIVDVKSASSRSFSKFKDGSIRTDDPFGYLDQLDGYVVGSADDSRVREKDRGYLLAVDKTLGHMALYEHRVRPEQIKRRIEESKNIVNSPTAPACNCGIVPVGSSGNLGLDTKASYSAWKYCCFPNLRTFLYASGPVYLTKVVRKPDVPEINAKGELVYLP